MYKGAAIFLSMMDQDCHYPIHNSALMLAAAQSRIQHIEQDGGWTYPCSNH